MAQNRSAPKIGCGLITVAAIACTLVAVLVIVPMVINSKAETQFGNASSELGFRQRVFLSTVILLHSKELTEPADHKSTEVSVTIETGESVSSIAEKLHSVGLIINPQAFSDYLQYSGMDTSIKAGDYTLNTDMTALQIAQVIQSSISSEVTLSILPGWRVEEIANSLPGTGLMISSQEFLDAVHSHPQGYSFSPCLETDSLEGYLSPGYYSLPRDATMADILPQILMNFEASITGEMKDGFAAQGLDLCQAVTLASIVQREAMVEDEMPVIASVFYNRLNSGATLASDPTVQYALGYNREQNTWWTNPLSAQDLKIDSPYNTYLYPSLPPGPISNPGSAALNAVAFPAQTSYYYFRAACDGSGRHIFSETYDEHLANACP